MANGAGQLVYGAARLTDEENALLRARADKLNKQFQGAGITMNNFFDIAFRVGLDIELRAIREEMEADKYVEPE